MDIKSTIIANSDILTTEIDDEIGMMNIEQGLYYTLNYIGKSIWVLLKEEIKISELLDILLKRYDVEYNKCKEDVLDLLMLLEQNNLIRVIVS